MIGGSAASGEQRPLDILFVHGVSVRRGPNAAEYDRGVKARHAAFRRYVFAGEAVEFHDPYWGDHGAKTGAELRSMVPATATALAIGAASIGAAAAPASPVEAALLKAARDDFGRVLNSLSLALIELGDPQSCRLAEALGAYAASLDPGDGAVLRRPVWLGDGTMRTDAMFLERLELEVTAGSAATLGLGDIMRSAGRAVVGSGIDLVDGPVIRLVRGSTPRIAQFIGDVFIYLLNGARRQAIRTTVVDGVLAAARSASARGSKLIVIGHSMGGIILYDLLSDPATVAEIEEALGQPLVIDLLLTVGTQIGLFEELALFSSSRAGTTPDRPACAKRWWHVFNRMDVLSLAVAGIVNGVEQFSVDTDANIVDAHSAYFVSPVFGARLRKRMLTAGLLS